MGRTSSASWSNRFHSGGGSHMKWGARMLRTRKSGYMQRRLVNALQDLRVNSDLSVKNSNGHIIQFVAGEDGVDPSKSEWGDKK